MSFKIKLMNEPTSEIAKRLNKWENDPGLVPFIRPVENREDLMKHIEVTVETLKHRLESHEEYLIYLHNQMIGEMSVQIDPDHLAKKENNTAWIGIYIGAKESRGKGAGTFALNHLENNLRERQFLRIELGVFEFNTAALKLYKRLGFREFTRIGAFTWWEGREWSDIRMEKYLK